MVTFLSGGTGTPKLLTGVPAEVESTVVANTGDDIELGNHLVCPDLDTVLFLEGDVLDQATWWGIEGDTAATHDRLVSLAAAAGLESGPRYLPADRQTAGRDLARWRRFSGVAEFMHIGDRDRAVHITRTSLLDEGYSLTDVTEVLGKAFEIECSLLPMSDDPVASLIHTPAGLMHFQAFWVAHDGAPSVTDVEFRGAEAAAPTEEVTSALTEPVIIGPSNPVTSIGPMLAMEGIPEALAQTPVVAVSPFIEDQVFSGPAAKLMEAAGYAPSTSGVAAAYPFVDAFVLDASDGTQLDRPVERTDTQITGPDDAARVYAACERALGEIA